MDLERIERALREGPADEPAYVPGAFRRPARGGRFMLAAAVAGALLFGVVIGVGLDALRSPSPGVGGPPVDLERLDRELAGNWTSEPATREQFVAFMTEAGHDSRDIEAFLTHDPIPTTVRWGLNFDGRGLLVVFRTLEDGETEILASGPYELLPDGRLRWQDLECVSIVEVAIEGDELSFGDVSTENCVADEHIAHSTFLGLASPYTRNPER